MNLNVQVRVKSNYMNLKKIIREKRIWLFILCFVLLKPDRSSAQFMDRNQPSTQWFEEAKYGLFLNLGLYSIPAGIWKDKKYYGVAEWVQRRAKIPIAEYKQLAAQFNPTGFDAEKIVQFAKQNGFRYIVFGAKYHDGFAMYGSKVSAFNIVDATPFKRDPVRELADACRKYDMKLGLYYSQSQDWYEADAIGNDWDFKDHKKNFRKYLDEKCKPQLEELLTNYGDVAILWFDTPQEITKEESKQLVDWVHKFQPGCLTSSRVGNGLGDYLALRDHELPTRVIDRPFEALFTHNDTWGYSSIDKNFRSPKEILRLLISSNTKGGNLIFNVCPTAEGVLQQESVDDVSIVGAWLQKNKEAVYGTTASPLPDLAWGGCTARPQRLYLHVMEWPAGGKLRVPTGPVRLRSAVLLKTGKKLTYKIYGNDLLIDVPLVAPDKLNTVIKLDYEGALQPPAAYTLAEGYTNSLFPGWAQVKEKAKQGGTRWMEEFGDWHYSSYIEGWTAPEDVAAWALRVPVAGKYWVVLDYGFENGKKMTEGRLAIGGREILFQAQPTGDKPQHFYEHRIGVIDIDKSEGVPCTVSPVNAPDGFIRLRNIRLVPYE